MLNLFKKKEKKLVHPVIVKQKKDSSVYIGQPVIIECDINRNGEEYYYFTDFSGETISNKIKNKDLEYCENYRYGLVKEVTKNNDLLIMVLCREDIYCNKYKIELNREYKNGEAFRIKNGLLYDSNIAVGKITDERYNNQNILLNALEDDRLIVFIQK